MLPEGRLSHQMSGRLRIRIPSKKRDVPFFSSLKEQLSRCSGVESLELNPLTGSVLIRHDSPAEMIREYVETHGLFKWLAEERSGTTVSAVPTPLSEGIISSYTHFDRRLREATGGSIDAPGLAFIVLVSLGIYEISRGNFAVPAWSTAFWYAFNVFLKGQPAAK